VCTKCNYFVECRRIRGFYVARITTGADPAGLPPKNHFSCGPPQTFCRRILTNKVFPHI